MSDQVGNAIIRTNALPRCSFCGAEGGLIYQGLEDRISGVPGKWNLKKCSNPKCRLIWLDPMPLEEDISKAYVKYFTHQDESDDRNTLKRLFDFAKQGYWEKKYGYFNDSVTYCKKLLGILIYLCPLKHAATDNRVRYLPARADGRLLDVGCGSGEWLRFMQDMGWHVEGIDVDPPAVLNARRQGVRVRLGVLGDYQYPMNCFDAITVNHVIEHVHHPLKLLAECQRILKPGGLMILCTPNSESWAHTKFKANWYQLDPPRHLYLMNMENLENAVSTAGFEVISNRSIVQSSHVFRRSYFLSKNVLLNNSKVQLGAVKISMAIIATIIQSVISIRKPNLGENIVLIARKTSMRRYV